MKAKVSYKFLLSNKIKAISMLKIPQKLNFLKLFVKYPYVLLGVAISMLHSMIFQLLK